MRRNALFVVALILALMMVAPGWVVGQYIPAPWFSQLGVARGPITIAQGTPATATPVLSMTSTWNDVAVTHLGIKYVITDSQSASGSLPFQILGGAAGTTNLFKVDKSGGIEGGSSIYAGLYFGWLNKTLIRGNIIDGSLTVLNNAATGFTTLNLGPTTGNTGNGTMSLSKVFITCTIATDTECSGKGTATITTATGIPAGSVVFAVDTNTTTIIAGSDGVSSVSIGATVGPLGGGADADAWGAGILVAAGTKSGIANFTINPSTWTAASTITITGNAGKVIDSGVIKITIYYLSTTPVAS